MKWVMEEKVKHRVVGIAVILSIAAIFTPAVMKKSNQRFEKNVSIAVKLPAQPMLPKVAIPQKKVIFEQVKVAQVRIPAVDKENFKPLATLARAESLSKLTAPPVTVAKTLIPAIPIPVKTVNIKQIPPAAVKKPVARLSINKTAQHSGYAVQLATFSKQNNALLLVDRLKKKGYPASFSKINLGKNIVYKVTVGQVNERQQARNLQQKLASVVQIKGFIIPTTG